MYLYAIYRAIDGIGQFATPYHLIHKEKFDKGTYFNQIKECYQILKKKPVNTNPFIKGMLKIKKLRPIDPEEIVDVMCEIFGYTKIEGVYGYKAWIDKTDVSEDIHGNCFMHFQESDLSEQWLESVK